MVQMCADEAVSSLRPICFTKTGELCRDLLSQLDLSVIVFTPPYLEQPVRLVL